VAIRNFLVKAKIDGSTVESANPVRIQQQLEGSVTTVAELSLAGLTPTLDTNLPVTIYHINKALPRSDGTWDSRQLFAGTINRIEGVGSPHGVSVSCTGQLAKLRRTRATDYAMAGKTDIQVVKDILTFCGITYTPADIQGYGYTIGTAPLHGALATDVRPYWRAGQSGAEMLQELDRVFGCATIELGNGRIQRFHYTLAPYRYDDPSYAKTFVRGQAGVTFYANERQRGDLDQIQNYWSVTGVSIMAAEGDPDEGCTFAYSATANADHAKLGAGVDVGPNSFSSDLIDSEALAKTIAIRLMQEHNREPDNVRIVCGNDAKVWPGALILVKDSSYGIDLASSKRYIVSGIAREGDTMTLDCIGGATGATGSVHSFLTKTCNDNTSNVGTDPSPLPDPGLGGPDFPSLGPIDDPVETPTEPETPKNTDDPFINCDQMVDGATGPAGEHVPAGAMIDGYVAPETLLTTNYRDTGRVAYHLRPNGTVDHIALGLTGTIYPNLVTPYADKTSDNDLFLPGGPGGMTISGELQFLWPGSVVSFIVRGFFDPSTEDVNQMRAEVRAVPGRTYTFTGGIGSDDDIDFEMGLFLNSENTNYLMSPYGSNECGLLFHNCDNGGVGMEGGFPILEWMPFSLTFDWSGEYQQIVYSIGPASGYMQDLGSITIVEGSDVGGGGTQHHDLCAHASHHFWIECDGLTPAGSFGPEFGLQASTYQARLRDVIWGHTSCEPNPDYIPPKIEGL
jgi:hypothetical protein